MFVLKHNDTGRSRIVAFPEEETGGVGLNHIIANGAQIKSTQASKKAVMIWAADQGEEAFFVIKFDDQTLARKFMELYKSVAANGNSKTKESKAKGFSSFGGRAAAAAAAAAAAQRHQALAVLASRKRRKRKPFFWRRFLRQNKKIQG